MARARTIDFATALAIAATLALGGCGGGTHTTDTSEALSTQTVDPEEAAEKRREAEEKLKDEREEERRIREHEPGAFGR
jgi:hypothetical protein